MHTEVNDVLIVGGGAAGLLTGLSIRKFNPKIEVSVVDDFDETPPNIGGATFQLITEILHDVLEIDEARFVDEVKPMWKASAYFRDWCGSSFQFPFDLVTALPNGLDPTAPEQYYYLYERLFTDPTYGTVNEEMVKQRKSPFYYAAGGDLDRYQSFAYHLNLPRFTLFLRDVARERGIELVDDVITSVATDGDSVTEVGSESETYSADLYVDASSFGRIMKRELGGEFRSFDFPLDSAINTQVDRPLSEVIPATVIESGEAGWLWQVDKYDDRDLGYTYASEFISDEAALEEFREHHGADVSAVDVSRARFDSGYFRGSWIDNCVAVGNSQGFVEPLKSTGLTANAKEAVTLANLLSHHGRLNHEGLRRSYNSSVERIWESIYDFVSLHYKYAGGDTAFWEAMASMEVSPRLSRIVETYDENGFVWGGDVNPVENADDLASLSVFEVINFYHILRCLGVESELYETGAFSVSDEVKRDREEFYQRNRNVVAGFLSVEEVYEGLSAAERRAAIEGRGAGQRHAGPSMR